MPSDSAPVTRAARLERVMNDPKVQRARKALMYSGGNIWLERFAGAILDAAEATLRCSCDDWEPQTKKIDGLIVLQQVRAGRSLPDGYFKAWKFCPWCGNVARSTPPMEEGV